MPNLLNFNSNRDLGFYHIRELQFDLDRPLDFDMNRELVFNPDRDLGFGKKGVLFRGFVCEKCDAIVSVDATSCDACGAVFEKPKLVGVMKASPMMTSDFERASAPTTTPATKRDGATASSVYPPSPTPRAIPPTTAAPQPPKTAPPTAPTTGSASRFCPNCGARSWQGDAFCWNCGARFTGSSVPTPPSAEKVQLPPKKAKKVVKDWQETGKTWEEYSEEK